MKLNIHILFLFLGIFYFSNCFAQYIDTLCVGEKNARYTVLLNNGSSYNWQVTGGAIVAGQGTNDIRVDWGNIAGTFEVLVTETNFANCVSPQAVSKVLLEAKPSLSVFGPDSVCKDQKFSLQVSGATNYLWSNGNTGNAIFEVANSTTNYFAIGTNLYCPSDTVFKTVTVIAKPSAIFNSNPVSDWIRNEEVIFSATDTSIRKWVWEINSVNQGINKPVISKVLENTGFYQVVLSAYNSFNCVDTFSISNFVFNKLDLYVPSAFTPNNDNLNDIFEPIGANFKSYQMQIYDHLGGLVYQGTDKGWDGNYNGELASSGSYTYIITITGLNGGKKAVDGNIVLVR